MEEAYSNKNTLLIIGGFGLAIVIAIAVSPLYVAKVEWEASMSWAGTICSIIGFTIAITQIYGVRKSTEAVNDAVAATKKDLEKSLSISDLSKYFEEINTIVEDIQQKEYKQALRSMKRLQDAIIEFREVPLTEIQDHRHKISQAIIKIGSDIEYMQILITGNDSFQSDSALRNLNRIQQFLSEIKAKLKHN